MANELVLVTGAAGGTQGKTGRHVSELLLKRGVPVRAFVRKIDERSEHLRALGAEVVAGDFLDYRSVERAVNGVSSIYFAYPVQPGLLDATAILADCARRARIRRVIDMVMLVSTPDAPTPRMRQNYLSEQIFEWAGVGAAHVRATVFFEQVRMMAATTIAAQGAIMLPWGSENTVLPLVSGEDVARVAAAVLTSPHVAPGISYPVIGQVLTLGDAIKTISKVLGRDIRYVEIPDHQWRDGALARGVNAHAVEHLVELWRTLRTNPRGFDVPDTIEQLSGQKPKTFEAFVREQQDVFKAKAA
jgi:uncharacterized protein YbjT (DUF2867 family)